MEKLRVCLGTVTSKSTQHAVQPLCSKGGGALFVFLLFMKFLLMGFIREGALGTVCSLLFPRWDPGFDKNKMHIQCVFNISGTSV